MVVKEDRIIKEIVLMLKYSDLPILEQLSWSFTNEDLFNEIIKDMKK